MKHQYRNFQFVANFSPEVSRRKPFQRGKNFFYNPVCRSFPKILRKNAGLRVFPVFEARFFPLAKLAREVLPNVYELFELTKLSPLPTHIYGYGTGALPYIGIQMIN